MRLTQTDREMLPEWVSCGEKSLSCFRWLSQQAGAVFSLEGKELQAYERGTFLFLYGRERNKYRIHGIYNSGTFELTDVSLFLQGLLEFPRDLVFRSRKTEEKAVARRVEKWLAYYLEQRSDLFYALGRSVIPVIDRSFIEKQAAIFFLNDARAEDIRYVPEFHFGEDTENFTMQLYLLCLRRGTLAEQAIAKQWIKRHGVEMYQQKIIYGCIRNEFEDILHSPRHRLHREKEYYQWRKEQRK